MCRAVLFPMRMPSLRKNARTRRVSLQGDELLPGASGDVSLPYINMLLYRIYRKRETNIERL